MVTEVQHAQIQRSTTRGVSGLAFLRQHPLAGYFLHAYGLQRLWAPNVAGNAGIPFLTEVGMLILGIMIIVATRGNLGYDRYQQKTAVLTTKVGDKQAPTSATAM